MFAADARLLSRIEPVLRRVIVADPNQASALLLADIAKSLGARDVAVASDQERVMALAAELEPGLFFMERSGARLDGEALVRRLRRSDLACRQAPIIMVTAEATASTIRGARDAGVHEFLRKPFTAVDVMRRVEIVATRPRDWIEAMGYVGPDRRRFNSGEYAGPRKRRGEGAKLAPDMMLGAKDQAVRILAGALNQFDDDPMQAVRAVRQQVETLKALAARDGDTQLTMAAAGVEAQLSAGPATKAGLKGPVTLVLALAGPAPQAKAG